MRTSVIIALLAVTLVAVCEARSLAKFAPPVKGLRQLRLVRPNFSGKAGRSFRALESTPTFADTTYCQGAEFQAAYEAAIGKCKNADVPNIFSDADSSAGAAFETFCASECASTMASFWTDENKACFSDADAVEIGPVLAMCQKDGEELCAVELLNSLSEMDCDQTSSKACEAKTGCMWHTGSASCDVNFDNVYDLLCTPCAALLLASYPASQASREQVQQMTMFCHKENGQYCGKYLANYEQGTASSSGSGVTSGSSSSSEGSSHGSHSGSVPSEMSGSSSQHGSSESSSGEHTHKPGSESSESSGHNSGSGHEHSSSHSGSWGSWSGASSSGASHSGASLSGSSLSGSSASGSSMSGSSSQHSGSFSGSGEASSGSSLSSVSGGSSSGSSQSGMSSSSGSMGSGSHVGSSSAMHSGSGSSGQHSGASMESSSDWSKSSHHGSGSTSSGATGSSSHHHSGSWSSESSHGHGSTSSSTSGHTGSSSSGSSSSTHGSGSFSGGSEADILAREYGRVCNMDTGYKCFRYVNGIIVESDRAAADKALVQCASSYSGRASEIVAECIPAFYRALREAYDLESLMANVCSRNPAGEWCLEKLQLFALEPCVSEVVALGKCESECDATLTAMFADLGCCVGTFEALLFTSWTFTEDQLPDFPSSAEVLKLLKATPKPTSTPAGAVESMKYFEVCSGVGTMAEEAACPAPESVGSSDPCFSDELLGLLGDFASACVNTANPLSEGFDSMSEANDAFGTFCASTCADVLSKLSNFAQCLETSTATFASLTSVMCQKDKEMYCGAFLTGADEVACDKHKTESACGKDDNCKWYGDECAMNPSEDFLTTMCSPCLSMLMTALGASEESVALGAVNSFMCQMEDTTFCLPIALDDFHSMGDGGFTADVLSGVCADDLHKKCMRRVINGLASVATTGALVTYKSCMDTAKTSTTQQTKCVEAYIEVKHEVSQKQKIVSALCRANQKQELCMSAWDKYAADMCIKDGKCSTACNTKMETLVDNLGCCLGTLHDIFKTPITTEEDLPVGAAGLVPTKQPSVPDVTAGSGESLITEDAGSGFAFELSACSSFGKSKLVKLLAVGCEVTRAATIAPQALSLPVVWAKLSKDPAAASQVQGALLDDIATALGSPKDAYTGVTLDADPNAQVAVSGRRMHTLAASAGTALNFKIQSDSSSDTTKQSSQLGSMVSKGTLPLSSAAATLDSACKGCIGAGGLRAAISAAPAMPVLAALLAALAALLLL